jgi:hypothetical protein
MIFAEDDDGDLRPVTREDLVRVWVWQQGRLHSQLVMAGDQELIIEAKRAEGWHAWATEPLLVVVN